MVLAAMPVFGLAVGGTFIAWWVREETTISAAALRGFAILPLATLLSLGVYAVATVIAVRLLGIGLREGYHPVRSRIGWQVWATERLLDSARTFLFPLYASLLTPVWLRLLGAKIGKNVEASTVLMLPKFTAIARRRFSRRRHHDRQLRTRRRLAAHRRSQGRQARLPRQFGDDRARSTRAEERPRRGALGRAEQGEGGLVVARQPARAVASRDRVQRHRAHLRSARAVEAGTGLVETCRLIPVMVTFAIGTRGTARARVDRPAHRLPGRGSCLGPGPDGRGRAGGNRRRGGEVVDRRANSRDRIPAVELVRVAQRGRPTPSSKRSRRRGSRVPPRVLPS